MNENSIKVNKENYCEHLKKRLFPAIKKLIKRDDWVFVQDNAPSQRSNLVHNFLEKTLKRRFVKCVEWPSSSPDMNPLDYLFWDLVKKYLSFELCFGSLYLVTIPFKYTILQFLFKSLSERFLKIQNMTEVF